MADPIFKDVPANQWTEVATGVISGSIKRLSTNPTKYLQYYLLVSSTEPDPTLRSEGAPLFEDGSSEPIRSSASIKIFLWVDGKAGRVRIDAS